MNRFLRLLTIVLALLAPSLAGGPARAAEPAWAQDFLSLCVGNLAGFEPVSGKAMALGYVSAEPDRPKGYTYFDVLDRSVGDDSWRLAVGQKVDLKAGAGRAYSHCMVKGLDIGTSGADAIRAWVGVEPDELKPGYVDFTFKIENGVVTSLADADEATLQAAFNSGGYWLLSIQRDGELTVVILTLTKAAS